MTWALAKLSSTSPKDKCVDIRIISLLVADPSDSGIEPVPCPLGAKGTLIIAPLSLLSNWTSQLEEHLQDSTLSVLVFHGTARTDPKTDLGDYDVVITSYGTLVSDYKSTGLESNPGKAPRKSKRSLFGRLWRRVVLDEGHTIRNPKAKHSRAATHIDAVTRWSLTGIYLVLRC
jgi:SWI/SNF-related matrix-associated actin-dependent regulator of chromatin subfamily A3